MKEELKDLSEEQKEKIVDEVNQEAESEEILEEGNTSIFNMDEIDENAGLGTPQEQYDRAIMTNVRATAILENILNNKSQSTSHKISNNNLKKLIFATLKMPEAGAVLKFGGTSQQQQLCEFAYAQFQLAANTRAFVLGVDAMRRARQVEKLKQEATEKSEVKVDK